MGVLGYCSCSIEANFHATLLTMLSEGSGVKLRPSVHCSTWLVLKAQLRAFHSRAKYHMLLWLLGFSLHVLVCWTCAGPRMA